MKLFFSATYCVWNLQELCGHFYYLSTKAQHVLFLLPYRFFNYLLICSPTNSFYCFQCCTISQENSKDKSHLAFYLRWVQQTFKAFSLFYYRDGKKISRQFLSSLIFRLPNTCESIETFSSKILFSLKCRQRKKISLSPNHIVTERILARISKRCLGVKRLNIMYEHEIVLNEHMSEVKFMNVVSEFW